MGHRKWMMVLVAAAAFGAARLQAQQLWEPEIGIRAGWTNVKINGVPNAVNFLDFPGSASFFASNGAAGRAPLFATIPLSARLALSPELGFTELAGSGAATVWETAASVEYAFTPKVYAGAGPNLLFVRAGGAEQAQLGIQASVGYRVHLSRLLRLKLEGFFAERPKANLLVESHAFGVALAFSTVLK